MSGTDTAGMVPRRYDVIIDGYGYILWNALMESMPFRNQRAAYSYTPTFLERTNVSGSYGDDTQDFFLTISQDDWSGGQGQHFLRPNDAASASKYYTGSQIEISTAGQVTIAPATQNVNDGNGGVALSACSCGATIDPTKHAYTFGTDLWTMTSGGTATDIGAHGAGTVGTWAMCTDGFYVYISGSSKLRKWDGTSFTDFSATPCGAIAFLNNTLYGFTAGKLVQYSTAGAQSDVFPWKYADGTADATVGVKLIPFGPDLLILFPFRGDRPELWLYDGTNTSKVAELPQSSTAYDIIEIEGVVFIGAFVNDSPSGFTVGNMPVVYMYTDGTLTEVWRANGSVGTVNIVSGTPRVALGTAGGRLIFTDAFSGGINQFDLVTGAVTEIGVWNHTEAATHAYKPKFSSTLGGVLLTWSKTNSASGVGPDIWPSSSYAASGTLQTSLVDFDNSLTKTMRSVKVDWFGGGSVDIAYQVDSLTGSYTALQTGAVSGVEYLLPADTQGTSISVQVTLNNSSGNVPTLKRVYVRAAPVQQSYRKCQYVLDLTGARNRSTSQPVMRRDGTKSNLTGTQMAANLVAAITNTVPISITDRFGTYTGIFEQGEGVTELDEVRPGEFIAQVTLREV